VPQPPRPRAPAEISPACGTEAQSWLALGFKLRLEAQAAWFVPVGVVDSVLSARRRLIGKFGLPCSTGSIARIVREQGRTRPPKKPCPPARSMAAEKSEWQVFGLLQVDVKDLTHLPGYRELIPFGLPRYQSTARVVPEGAVWLAFSAVNDSTYALPFADRLPAHFQRCGWISASSSSSPTTAASSAGAGIAGMACRPLAGWRSRNTAVGLTASIPLAA